MRRFHSLKRALAHPSGGALPRRVAPSPAGDAGAGTIRPEAANPHTSDTDRGGRTRAADALLVVAGLLAAACVASALSGGDASPAVTAIAASMAAIGIMMRRPCIAQQVFAAVVGIALLPALLVIALAVRLSSPGPILVRQTRPDPDGRPYRALRFRTTWTAAANRTTPVGRLLYTLSLDELPALLDMARGKLSLLKTRCH